MKKSKMAVISAIMAITIFAGCGAMGADRINEEEHNQTVQGFVMRLDENRALITNEPSDAYWFSDLQEVHVGQKVIVRIDGPVMESYPMQAKAHSATVVPVDKPELSEWTVEEVIQTAMSSEEAILLQVPMIRSISFDEAHLEWEVTLSEGFDQSHSVTVKVK